MSDHIDAGHRASTSSYVAERTAREDEFLGELKRAATRGRHPADLDRARAGELHADPAARWPARARRGRGRHARRLLGDRDGARAARGRARAHDRARRGARRLRRALDREVRRRRARSRCIAAPASTCCRRFADGSADAAFLDADKASYPVYLARVPAHRAPRRPDHGRQRLRLRAAPRRAADGPRAVAAVRAFNDLMARQPGFQSVIVPIGDGLWVGVQALARPGLRLEGSARPRKIAPLGPARRSR